MTEKEFRSGKKALSSKLIALKDFHIFQPPHADIRIKEGDDLAEIPEMYHNNLIAEGVLKG
jgi:hypothetical protein